MPTELLSTRTLADLDGLLYVGIGAAAGLILARVLLIIVRRFAQASTNPVHEAFVRAASTPLLMLGFLLGARASLRWIDVEPTLRNDLHTGVRVAFVLLVAWGVLRAASTAGDLARSGLHARGRVSVALLVPVAVRVVRWLTIGLAVLGILAQFGVDVTHLVAGLGIGGIAMALAAQKTLENLFGGLSVVLDQPLRPGDSCRIGTVKGVVEEIGLRSTRVRTADQTVVALPNATVANAEIENMSVRTGLRYQMVLPMRPDAPADTLEACTHELADLMKAEPMLTAASVGVQVKGWNAGILEVECTATTTTTKGGDFAPVRERLTISLLRAIEAKGLNLPGKGN
ncbi:MAG: mechanosensitive ion channel family protein [Planctomycetes bacterium]|nr:mechanosensitive ion channel family protein [Planctomycetota bacterium]